MIFFLCSHLTAALSWAVFKDNVAKGRNLGFCFNMFYTYIYIYVEVAQSCLRLVKWEYFKVIAVQNLSELSILILIGFLIILI